MSCLFLSSTNIYIWRSIERERERERRAIGSERDKGEEKNYAEVN